MNEIAIKVNDLTKTYRLYENDKRRIVEGLIPWAKPHYREFHALRNVDFEIKKGEIVGIIGKNGSGKSTLLKIITGVLKASQGTVVVNGRISALLELGAGFNPEYTGIENIYLNGTLNKISREEMDGRINDIADFADIGEFIHQPVKNYSSGMFVRLAFAVAIYSDPDILIVDEALAVGDAAFQAKCMARMNQIMKSGATVLFVTHDMNTVKSLCQRCIYLENGVKIMEGPAEELADIYLKRIRASMNEEHLKLEEDKKKSIKKDDIIESQMTQIINTKKKENESEELKEEELVNQTFIKKTSRFLEGTGAVEFIDLRLMNSEGEETVSFSFGEKMHIKVRLKVHEEHEFGVAYHIRDDKSIELIGSSTFRELGTMIDGKSGEIYEIEFIVPLPIIEGNYSITILASSPVIKNRTALFLAMMDNAAVFSVEENFGMKLWDKIYLKNEVTIKKIH